VIVGKARDANGEGPAFVHAPNGTVITFEAPSARLTTAYSINPAYADASDVAHGFVRTPHGSITTFDAPSASTGSGQGTFPDGINDAGAITGYHIDNNDVLHGFLRTRNAW